MSKIYHKSTPSTEQVLPFAFGAIIEEEWCSTSSSGAPLAFCPGSMSSFTSELSKAKVPFSNLIERNPYKEPVKTRAPVKTRFHRARARSNSPSRENFTIQSKGPVFFLPNEPISPTSTDQFAGFQSQTPLHTDEDLERMKEKFNSMLQIQESFVTDSEEDMDEWAVNELQNMACLKIKKSKMNI